MELARAVAVARGDEPADLVLRNGLLVNVLSNEVYPTDVALAESIVVGLGQGYQARETLDLDGMYIAPGFIDAHVHLESSIVLPSEFARAVVPRGVTTVVTNPHEIANVAGTDGVRFLLREARRAPLTVYTMAPSCVPASRLETSGASLGPADLAELLGEPLVLGLGEVMDVAGVLSRDERVLGEIAVFAGRPVDGHCPRLSGRDLNAYCAAGISSDHESTTLQEAAEKLCAGLAVFLREGTAARDLKALLPLVNPATERRLCLCTDDRLPADLIDEGSIDHLIRICIAQGVDPVTAIRLGTLNPADHYGLRDRGAVAPGRRADLVVFRDLRAPRAELVFQGGRLVAQGGRLRPEALSGGPPPSEPAVRDTVRVDWSSVDFAVAARGTRMRAIGVVPDEIVTEHLVIEPRVDGGLAVADPERDVAKMAVIERHRASGNLGLGFVRGMGIRAGAVASTVAHDHHNLVVLGADDLSMYTAARAVAESGGGQAAARGEAVLARLELPIAGIISDRPLEAVRSQRDSLLAAARSLGSPLRDPFETLSFLALEVVPSLKLTDRGLVDVDRFELVPLFIEPGDIHG